MVANYVIDCQKMYEMGVNNPFVYLNRAIEFDASGRLKRNTRIYRIPDKASVYVFDTSRLFAHIKYDNIIGYISRSWLKRVPIQRKLSSLIIRKDPEQEFITMFSQKNGFQIRFELPNGKDPTYSTYPELLDMTITHKCGKGCKYCYMNSTSKGEHAKLYNIKKIFKQLENRVFSVALGGGEPTLHPRFEHILRTAVENNIVPSFSTAYVPTPSFAQMTAKYCGAVAMSYHGSHEKVLEGLRRYYFAGIDQVNVHVVLGVYQEYKIRTLLESLAGAQRFGVPVNAVIFLRRKPVGRATTQNNEEIHDNNGSFNRMIAGNYPFKLGIDSCLAPIVAKKYPDIAKETYDYCEAGQFSFYVDAVNMQAKECSFDMTTGFDLREIPVLDAWNQMNKVDPRIGHCKLSLWREERNS